MVRILAEVLCRTLRPEFRVPTDFFLLFAQFFLLCTTNRPKIRILNNLFLLCTHDHSTEIYGPLSFILFFLCTTIRARLGSSPIYFFYLHATIQQKYLFLFHLILLLRMTIRPEFRVSMDLFLLCAHDHLTEIYDRLSFILYFVNDHLTKT